MAASDEWATTIAEIQRRPVVTAAGAVVIHDPHGVLAGLGALRSSVPGPDPAPAERPSRPFARIREIARQAGEGYQHRADAFHHEIVRVLERLVSRDREREGTVLRLAAEIAALRHDLDRVRTAPPAVPTVLAAASPTGGPVPGSAQPGIDYKAFEDRHRGSREQVLEMQRAYADLFDGGPVLDVGCGRGEFLELLGERGVDAYGVDLDTGMVADAQSKHLDARVGDAVAHLEGLEPESLGGIFSAQVAEHLTPEQLARLCHAATRALRPGAPFVAETPNPESLYIFASFFYVDLSHTNPIHPEAFRFLLESAGFDEVRMRRSEPVPAPLRLEVPDNAAGIERRNLERLNDLLYGPQQYAVIASRTR